MYVSNWIVEYTGSAHAYGNSTTENAVAESTNREFSCIPFKGPLGVW